MSTRSTGRRMTPERQQRILDVAVDIAIEDGFNAITMQAVAQRARYIRPVVYDCFPSPEAIIIAALDREFETVTGEIERLEPMRARPRTWLLLSVPTEGTPETVRTRMNDIRETLRRSFEHALVQAVHDMPDPKLDTEVASYLIQDIAHAFAQRMIAQPENYPVPRITAFIDTLLRKAEVSIPVPFQGDHPFSRR